MLYRWNRRYPSDVKFDLPLEGFQPPGPAGLCGVLPTPRLPRRFICDETHLCYLVVSAAGPVPDLTGCGTGRPPASSAESQSVQSAVQSEPETSQQPAQDASSAESQQPGGGDCADLSSLPAYAGEAYVALHDNQPYFSQEERQSTEAFETYSPLDSLGRCGWPGPTSAPS